MSEEKQVINLVRKPIGINFLNEKEMPEEYSEINPKVRSFCDAIRLVHKENYPDGIIVTNDSISACKWCPVSLGLKKPESGLEKKIEPLFKDLNEGVYVNIQKNNPNGSDVVTLVADQENTRKIIDLLDIDSFNQEYLNKLFFSNLSEFTDLSNLTKKELRKRRRNLRSIRLFKWLFASKLIKNKPMTKILTFFFKQYLIARIMDPILRKFSTGTSFCYTTSSMPFITQKANVAFPCTGAIGWGDVSKDSILIGLPNNMFKSLDSKATFQISST